MALRHWHWQPEPYRRNFGDELGLYVLQKLYPGLIERTTDLAEADIVSIGSIFDERLPDRPLIVWGTGGHEPEHKSLYVEKYKVLAVRGELTRSKYGLPDSIPLGDPAFLLPLLYTPKPTTRHHITYIPHLTWYHDAVPEWADAVVRPDRPIEDTVDAMCSSDMVVSSAMHPYWVARLYGVTAVPIVNYEDRVAFGGKWVDFESALLNQNLYTARVGLIRAIESELGPSTLHHVIKPS